ncbi:ABC transporter ATP-binding protein/permease [Ureaplasma sp. ES3154-GEN]|uniref:ABC transporter ATP-binding protein n=1 Tax=Ureaplasma sp. ES3154-GEN TaxID=2984844 RepID=UPI0021E8C905|nr:ABC transporter ATP-binding protein [Ureaplasma sp. ES3154-GEN]MCV3743791.1 ABC transporter ATP-binding protein/permease [Ureaplasma sp. ES3154-GEN]
MGQTFGSKKTRSKSGNQKTRLFSLIWNTLNKRSKWLIAIVVFLNLIQVGVMVVSPIVMKAMQNSFDSNLQDNGQSNLLINSLIMLTLVIIWAILAMLGNYLSVLVDVNLTKSLQLSILNKTLDFSKADESYFSEEKLLTITINDTARIQDGVRALTRGLLIGIVYLIGGFVALIIISYQTYSVWLTIFSFMLLIFGIEAIFFRWIRQGFEIMTRENNKVISLTTDYTNGYQTIKNFVLQSFFLNDLKNQWNNYKKHSEKSFRLLFLLIVLITKLSFIIQPIILVIMFYAQPKVPYQNIYPIFQATNILVLGIFITSGSLQMFMRSLINFNRVNSLLRYQPKIDYIGVKNVKNKSIVFENVSFSYPDQNKKVLENISFSLSANETLGIIGKTGSGKTTLLYLLTHKLQPTSGVVKIGGTDLKEINYEYWKHQYSYCDARPTLINDSIKNNVCMGDVSYDKEKFIKNLQIAQAYNFVSLLKNKENTVINTKGTNLSGGQKQRIALSRAISKHASLLILDDATSALDVLTEKAFMDGLKTLDNFEQKIIVSQRINNVEDCDKILVLDEGKIVGFGNSATLLATCPFYQEMYETQSYNVVQNYEQ